MEQRILDKIIKDLPKNYLSSYGGKINGSLTLTNSLTAASIIENGKSLSSKYSDINHIHTSIKSLGRLANANIAQKGSSSMNLCLATTAMTSNKPNRDGYIMNFDWDSTAGWSSQLFLSNGGNPIIQFRSMNSGAWEKWNTVYSTNNKPTLSELGAAAASHTHNYAGSSTPGGAATNSLKLNGFGTGKWGAIPIINNDGGIEIGKYIDFHLSSSDTADYAIRIIAGSNGLNLSGTTSGTFSGSWSGPLTSNLLTESHLNGNQGKAIINSTSNGTGYTMLAKANSTNGVWTIGNWNGTWNLFFTKKDLITAKSNTYSFRTILMDESGNMTVAKALTSGGNIHAAGWMCLNKSGNRKLVMGGKDDYCWIDSRDSSDKVINNIVIRDGWIELKELRTSGNIYEKGTALKNKYVQYSSFALNTNNEALKILYFPNGIKMLSGYVDVNANAAKTITYASGTFHNNSMRPSLTLSVPHNDYTNWNNNAGNIAIVEYTKDFINIVNYAHKKSRVYFNVFGN